MKLRYFLSAILLFVLVNMAYSQVVITTRLSERFLDKSGNPLTGKGVVIGDIDSGIDVFHPFYFFADGGEFSWIDTDGDGGYSDDDAVDINANGAADPGESLRFINMGLTKTYGLLKGSRDFEADMDFLYNDKNNNKKRDFGEKDGFTEQDPTFGEQFYIVMDINENNKLDAGEKIIALKTSKVRAVMQKDGTVRRRGTDLIKTESDDEYEHGTSVSSIIMGGHYGVQKIHGLAPDAEMVFANIKYGYTPRFVRNFPELFSFIKNEGVNIMLIEDGEFAWEFMDGSTEEEQMINQFAREGIFVVGGAGNLAGANAYMKDGIRAGKTETYKISSPDMVEGKKNDGMFPTFLWKNKDNNITFRVKAPDGAESEELSGGSGFINVGKYHVYYAREVSQKGTVMFRFGISEKDSGSVDGDWEFRAESEENDTLHGFVVDISQSWAGHTHWTSHTTDIGTVTFPSTGDSCISVAAYTVNYPLFPPNDVIGGIAPYSGRGFTIGGKNGVDITAPGHTTFAASPGNNYSIFTGTSAAAPHVVGTAALLLQYNPALTHAQIRNILITTAAKDSFTGTTPNTTWGYGKLNIEGAIRFLMQNSN
jgi:subtilisin family serine protease